MPRVELMWEIRVGTPAILAGLREQQENCGVMIEDGFEKIITWKPGMEWETAIEELRLRKEAVQRLGGKERIDRQHGEGKQTIRERIEQLADPGSFFEVGSIMGISQYDENGDIIGMTPGTRRHNLFRISGTGEPLSDVTLALYSVGLPSGLEISWDDTGGLPGTMAAVLAIDVPADMTPGEYTFEIGLEIDGKDYGTVPCTVEVVEGG